MERKNGKAQEIFRNPIVRVILLIFTITTGLVFFQIPYVDDIPYYQTVEEKAADYTDFKISDDTGCGKIGENAFVISPGEGEKVFSAKVSLLEGDLFQVYFTIDNQTEETIHMVVDLCGPGYDLTGMESALEIKPGTQSYSVVLPYYRAYRPTSCNLRIMTSDNTASVLTDLRVVRQKVLVGGNVIVKSTTIVAGTLFGIFVFFLLYSVALLIQEKAGIMKSQKKKVSVPVQEILMYLGITGIVLVTLLILYRNVEIICPLNDSGDAMGVHYYGKLIDEYGISLVGHRTGGLSGADMYDYPYSDTLSFLLVKTIGIFTDNPYLIINLFFFLCFFLAAYISAACMRYLKVSRIPAMLLSVLYAFSPYIQRRYGHMWLVPYFLMPVACVLAISIMHDALHRKKNTEDQRNHFSKMLFLAFCCAFTGLYYAFFACTLIAVGTVILWLNRPTKGMRRYLYPLGYLGAVLIGVGSNVVPNAVYHMIHGPNPAGELELRTAGEAEYYALKLVQLLLPHRLHRIQALADLSTEYYYSRPLVNENSFASLGLVASIGLIISLVFLFCKKREKEISYLNIAMILIGTIGGISSVLTVFVDIPIRCYNRLSVVIMFLSLLQIAVLLDCARVRMKNWVFATLCIGLTVLGLFDQTFTHTPVKYEDSTYEHIKVGIQEIEAAMPEGAYIFQFPFSPWPTGNTYRNYYGYLESDKLHWSYGAMQGREESDWQMHIATWDIDSMVRQLREAGYDGLYIDSVSFYDTFNQIASEYIGKLKAFLGEPVVEKGYGDGTIYCWRL